MDVARRKVSPQTIKILELRQRGLKQTEIANTLGCKLDSVKNACRYMPFDKPEKLTEEDAKAVISKAGYDYISGFANAHSKVVIRCRECGGVFEKMYKHLYSKAHGTYKYEMTCPHCKQLQIEERKRLIEKQTEYDARTKAEKRAQKEADLISRQTEERLAIHICKNCGTSYCIELTGYNSKRYCSEKCMKRWAMRIKNDRRHKKILSRRHDADITLERLFQRDKGICYLCFWKCDWNDIDEYGNARDNYPSIDHVKPIAKGGTHTWDNVKLAHRKCNWEKRDSDYAPVG